VCRRGFEVLTVAQCNEASLRTARKITARPPM